MRIPFDVASCSWPRPIGQANGRWISEPEWDAPLMPIRPQPYWRTLYGEPSWTIDWRGFFKTGLKPYHHDIGGEMRGFHVVFALRIMESGKLVFWSDDGCVIYRDGQLVHHDRTAHSPTRNEIDVVSGDLLQVAQWQQTGDWLWGAQ